MQTNTNQTEGRGVRRTPIQRMRSEEQTRIHMNPLFEGQTDQRNDSEPNSSLRRQASEPARSQFAVLKSNIVSRTESIKSTIKEKTYDFFGLDKDNQSKNDIWQKRRIRLLDNYGKVKKSQGPELQTRTYVPKVQTTGLDETDGVSQINNMTAFTEHVPQYAPESGPELVEPEYSVRSPAYKITFKAVAMASSALKRKISNKSDNKMLRINEQLTDRQRDGSESMTADSVFYRSDELPDYCDEHFFQDFPSVTPEEEEVDFGRKFRGMPSVDKKWALQRQMSVKAKGIPQQLIDTYMDNSNRRKYGLGIVGKLLNRKLKSDLTKEELKALDHIDDHRPYFTYWITTVQILIFVISVMVYGFGHFGFGRAHIMGLVLVKSLSLQQVDYFEPQSMWFGPRSADLIHLGAKFTPCMRKDSKTFQIIEEEREVERNTGCCIRNDGSGCVQSSKHNCSPLLSTWHKWNNNTNLGPTYSAAYRTSGPICGQDPRHCEQPASIEPYEWPDSITKWPICRKKSNDNLYEEHMICELIGRPCCFGVYGQCQILTRDHCDFVKGFFHEEATLCSQVSCMEDICGMITFWSKDRPDQIYRAFIPIFLHSGVGHLIITVVFQYYIMRDIEKLTGLIRIAFIYLLSGIGGYLASAAFSPFRPEVGPAGAHFGLLACLFIEVKNMWNQIERPFVALLKLIVPAVILILIGFLPWVDNFAHMVGFVIGLLLSVALLPYISISKYNRTTQIIGSLVMVGLIFILLVITLYQIPIYESKILKYLDCIPLTDNWCDNQEILINNLDIL